VSYFDTLKRNSDMHKSTRSNITGLELHDSTNQQPSQPFPDDQHPNEAQQEQVAEQPMMQEPEEQEDEREPKLYVDVNVANFGLQRIIVYEGDTVESLVADFVKRCPIDEFMIDKLKTLLQ